MSTRSTPSLRSGGTLAAALLTLAACHDAPLAPTAPSAPRTAITAVALKRDKLATIEMMGRWPALFIQNGDGTGRFQVHFENVRDRIAGNYTPDELPVTDRTIWALGPARWSPDAQQLAVVVTLGMDVSEVVVMDADGRNMRTVSPNSQVITGDIEWAPDSRAIAYTMSTDFLGRRPDLFVTDLVKDEVTRLTTTRSFSVWDEYRFDPSGQRVWFTQFAGWSADGLDRVSRLDYADLAGNRGTTGRTIVGNPQGISRDGAWALVLRHAADGATWEFARSATDGSGDRVLASGAGLLYAELLSDDAEAVLVGTDASDPWSGTREYAVRGVDSGDVRALLPVSANASSMALMRARR